MYPVLGDTGIDMYGFLGDFGIYFFYVFNFFQIMCTLFAPYNIQCKGNVFFF